jgi:hypothetical protein
MPEKNNKLKSGYIAPDIRASLKTGYDYIFDPLPDG